MHRDFCVPTLYFSSHFYIDHGVTLCWVCVNACSATVWEKHLYIIHSNFHLAPAPFLLYLPPTVLHVVWAKVVTPSDESSLLWVGLLYLFCPSFPCLSSLFPLRQWTSQYSEVSSSTINTPKPSLAVIMHWYCVNLIFLFICFVLFWKKSCPCKVNGVPESQTTIALCCNNVWWICLTVFTTTDKY